MIPACKIIRQRLQYVLWDYKEMGIIMKKYFFIDFDNTIFSHRTGRIPESAYEALNLLKKEGHMFILSSGRPLRPDSKELAGYGLSPDGFICANGAIVAAEGKLLHETFMDAELQKRLLDYILEKEYCLMGRCENKWYTSNLERLPERMKQNKTIGTLLDGKDFLTLYEKPMHSFFLSDSMEAIEDVQAHFPDLKLLCMGSELGGADVIPRANSKAAGLSLILDHYGVSPDDAVAIGDSMNDLEMIRRAGFGIAMGNAMEEVRKVADYVAPDIDEDGLADAIYRALKEESTSI